jgi:hypothetical protein
MSDARRRVAVIEKVYDSIAGDPNLLYLAEHECRTAREKLTVLTGNLDNPTAEQEVLDALTALILRLDRYPSHKVRDTGILLRRMRNDISTIVIQPTLQSTSR